MKRFLYHIFRRTYNLKHWIVRRFTTSGRVVLLCLAVSAVVGLDTKQTMAYQAFAFLLAIVVVAMVSSLFLAVGHTRIPDFVLYRGRNASIQLPRGHPT